jgi:hypothetical protein
MEEYRGRPMDFAGASVVALVEARRPVGIRCLGICQPSLYVVLRFSPHQKSDSKRRRVRFSATPPLLLLALVPALRARLMV